MFDISAKREHAFPSSRTPAGKVMGRVARFPTSHQTPDKNIKCSHRNLKTGIFFMVMNLVICPDILQHWWRGGGLLWQGVLRSPSLPLPQPVYGAQHSVISCSPTKRDRSLCLPTKPTPKRVRSFGKSAPNFNSSYFSWHLGPFSGIPTNTSPHSASARGKSYLSLALITAHVMFWRLVLGFVMLPPDDHWDYFQPKVLWYIRGSWDLYLDFWILMLIILWGQFIDYVRQIWTIYILLEMKLVRSPNLDFLSNKILLSPVHVQTTDLLQTLC